MPVDVLRGLTASQGYRFQALVRLIERTGARSFQVRYSDDEQPVVWVAVAIYAADRAEAAAGLDPLIAAARLAERLIDGGVCTHCERPTALEPFSLDSMPMGKHLCWYQYDPELKTYRRGCE